MAFKPNYRQQRNERTRTKEAKKEKKLARLQERVEARKAVADQTATPDKEKR